MKRLALVITGDRHATDEHEIADKWFNLILEHLRKFYQTYGQIVLIHGACGESVGTNAKMKGIDAIAHMASTRFNEVATVPMPADWEATGRRSGPMRNRSMLGVQEWLGYSGYDKVTHAYHDGDINQQGSGTGDCFNESKARQVESHHFRSDGTEVQQ